ncbi:GNAT family N-acetyltransferase [Lentiprolixibacter aurantiacus]|uniref:GNAT family N-acetyltransferase n=1 Tax=Lentiprolixibacter aurantiacus TaxID=2993939 RepID=A0AAE3SPE0_9FLAO|nr:GNAT family N-acetyltransferase [Lentiprolixibacter aurantiacus]MCX2720510.1 GNAT family N-acetyltransferase [Lentiprolixibacter aurantiacus]
MDNHRIKIIPVGPEHYETYIRVGRKSYSQHYLHLWKERDPSPYFEKSFHKRAVKKEWEDPDCLLFLIYVTGSPAGILKIVLNKAMPLASISDCLFLERIYLLKEFSGQGVGTYALGFVERLCRKYYKNYIWLESMQKGKAIEFYKQNGFNITGEKQLSFPGLVESERPMYIMGKKLV